MDDGSVDSSKIDREPDAQSIASANSVLNNATDAQSTASADSVPNTATDAPSKTSTSGVSLWGKTLKIPQPLAGGEGEPSPAKSAFARFTSGLSMRLSPRAQTSEQGSDGTSAQSNIIGNITKGIVDSSKSAVKAVTVKARHVVSQNKRRYQEGGFDLDMTYITENIIAMGFPAGDMSSGFFGYVEGIYRNHMEEVIRFFETRHKGKYKVYNLCSERLYDASLFEGKVACFPFDDHNCPPLHLIKAFCLSAYSWLKEDLENVVVVHCKAGMARTGLMISSLILYLKFFPTAEESIAYYNQKRCYDAKALVLPSQIRYVKYFERILTYFNGDNQPGRRCMLRGFRFHRCPYWIRPHISICDHNGVLFSTKGHPRTKDQSPEEFWFRAPTKKGIMVFALPGEPGLTELEGDFKVHFHDNQGDFYFWLNTTMIENRMTLNTNDIDGFDKRKLPSPGFQIEVVLVDYDGLPPPESPPPPAGSETSDKVDEGATTNAAQAVEKSSTPNPDENPESRDKDDVFSDGDGEEGADTAKSRKPQETTSSVEASKPAGPVSSGQVENVTQKTEQISLEKGSSPPTSTTTTTTSSVGDQKSATVPGSGSGNQAPDSGVSNEFKVVSADASVFTFGDEEDYESD